jgi:hypothetical protein
MQAVLSASQAPPQPQPAFSAVGEPPTQNMTRSDIAALSTVVTTGSLMTVVGVSSGRLFYGARLFAGTTGVKTWTVLAGADPAKMKAVATGTVTPAVANTIVAFGFAAPVWIPAGQTVAVQATTPAASAWGGKTATVAAVHRTGLGFLLAATAVDTVGVAAGTTVNLHASGGKYTVSPFRMWAELL